MKFNKLYEFKASSNGILSIAKNNNIIYIACEDNYITAFNLINYQLVSKLKAHTKDVLSVKISPDSKSIFSTSKDGYIKQWDLNLKLIYEYPSHKSDVNAIDFLDEKRFISGSDDSTFRIWTVGSNEYKEINPLVGDINTLKITQKYILIGGSKLIVFDKSFKEIKSDDSYIYGISLIKHKESKIYISTSMEKYLEIWNEEELQKIKRIKFTNWINDILFVSQKIIIAHANMISIYDSDMNLISENDFHSDEIYALEFFENKLVTASNDSYVRIWELLE